MEKETLEMQKIGLAHALASYSLSTTLLLTLFKSKALTKQEAIQIIKASRATPKEHPFPTLGVDALKFSDELLEMVETVILQV